MTDTLATADLYAVIVLALLTVAGVLTVLRFLVNLLETVGNRWPLAGACAMFGAVLFYLWL